MNVHNHFWRNGSNSYTKKPASVKKRAIIGIKTNIILPDNKSGVPQIKVPVSLFYHCILSATMFHLLFHGGYFRTKLMKQI